MARKAAWTARLICDGCGHRSGYVNGGSRECPECGRFLRMELKRRVPTEGSPAPARRAAEGRRRRRNRTGLSGMDTSFPLEPSPRSH